MSEFTLHPWPGPVPAPQDGVFVIRVASSTQREVARQQVRAATSAALAAVLGIPPETIHIDSTPGQPPHITLDGDGRRIGCSFSHEEGYSLAAVNLHGAVGVDLMRVYEVFDWQAVARDYLGPEACAALAATPAADSTLAFVLAWTRHEAALKCHGMQLVEWSEDLAVPATVTLSAMLPDNLVASLARPLQDPPQ
ncbi:4'-phosphopantetheinyl transferase superfamily protein [Rugamonas sp. FT82W]|uniref:4'-phosphopantetheinyl transferase superfamily protein n=1 Tax=Duganella vulcania TaxID=2692166 RepID=A0A845G0R5_9BURK|nr:4'-phosphopantetheinyl transferase superfamily protein [Duganella vulcania]MYM86358.1 4'-phosphopantetheinyl transferase superfamily protein [Duganella vulcania]